MMFQKIRVVNPFVDLTDAEKALFNADAGTMSKASYAHAATWNLLNELFQIRRYEKLIGIVVDDTGITAKIGFTYDRK